MWFWLIEEVESVRRFLGLGGDVLVALFFLTLVTIVLLRFVFKRERVEY